MSALASSADPALRSEMADDPDFAPLIELYAASVEEKVAALRKAAEALPEDREPVRALAHQIKGSAGGYGFPQVTAAAAETLVACREGEDVAVRATLEALIGLVKRISA
jgi:HPt (histidine-containing phosphotransfer) domain-containing protein